VTAAEQLPKFLAGDPALGAAASGGAPWLHRPQSPARVACSPAGPPQRKAAMLCFVQCCSSTVDTSTQSTCPVSEAACKATPYLDPQLPACLAVAELQLSGTRV